MNSKNKVLLVDDRGDIVWLIDYLEARGYEIERATNEEAARRKLESVRGGRSSYVLAIIDIMVAVKDIMDLIDLDEVFFEESRDTGIRLCRYAREELGISAEKLPIVCISARDDFEKVQRSLDKFNVKLFRRVPQTPEESIRYFVEKSLPKIEKNRPNSAAAQGND